MFEANLFKDQVAVITGGGTGIGLAIARRLGALGARIAIASRNSEHLEAGWASLREAGVDALAVQLDVRNPEQVDEMVVRTVKHFGSLDILVNNAAGNFVSRAEPLAERLERVTASSERTPYCSAVAKCDRAVDRQHPRELRRTGNGTTPPPPVA